MSDAFSALLLYRNSCSRTKVRTIWWRKYSTPTCCSSKSISQLPLLGTSLLHCASSYRRYTHTHVLPTQLICYNKFTNSFIFIRAFWVSEYSEMSNCGFIWNFKKPPLSLCSSPACFSRGKLTCVVVYATRFWNAVTIAPVAHRPRPLPFSISSWGRILSSPRANVSSVPTSRFVCVCAQQSFWMPSSSLTEKGKGSVLLFWARLMVQLMYSKPHLGDWHE